MYNDTFEQWLKMGKNLNYPLGDLSKATADICRTTTQEGLDMFNDNIALITDQMKRLSNIRKPEELVNLSRDCLTEDMHAIMGNLQKFMQLSARTVDDISRLSNQVRDTGNMGGKTSDREKNDKSR